MSWRQTNTLIILTLTLLVSAGPLCAKFDPGSEIASREKFDLTSESVRGIGPSALETTGEIWICVYDPVSGRSLWTKFDPLGLYTIRDYEGALDNLRDRQGKELDALNTKLKGMGVGKRKRKLILGHQKAEGKTARQIARIEGKIAAIHQTASDISRFGGVDAVNAYTLDDQDPSYKAFVRDRTLARLIPGSSVAESVVIDGSWSGAAKNLAIETALWYAGGRLVRPGAGSLRVASSGGGKHLPMSTVRIINRGETIAALKNEVKALTWQTGNEHAVVTLANGKRAIVSGGPGGITFKKGQIKTLFGHTHPTSAAPSADDAAALKKLGQSQQTVLHGGEVTKVRPK